MGSVRAAETAAGARRLAKQLVLHVVEQSVDPARTARTVTRSAVPTVSRSNRRPLRTVPFSTVESSQAQASGRPRAGTPPFAPSTRPSSASAPGARSSAESPAIRRPSRDRTRHHRLVRNVVRAAASGSMSSRSNVSSVGALERERREVDPARSSGSAVESTPRADASISAETATLARLARSVRRAANSVDVTP